MNYELAKKLKQAGWKFHRIAEGKESWDGKVVIFGHEDQTPYALPTLSELIEACGDKFVCLNRYAKNSKTDVFWDVDCSDTNIGTWSGSTPEEAVAHLFLALNSDKIKQ